MIRLATADDLPVLRDIERAAGEAFRAIGMPEIADDEPLPLDVLDAYRQAGRAWVATGGTGGTGGTGHAWEPTGETGRASAAGESASTPDTAHQAGSPAGSPSGNPGLPLAYLVADVVDGYLHIEQVSVHPQAARRGIGRRLIEHAAAYAEEHGLRGLTLTTFTDVPWNAPYYERCGFQALPESELTPGLREVRRQEAGHGLDRWRRIVMRRPAGG